MKNKENIFYYIIFILSPFVFFYPFLKNGVIIGVVDSLNNFFPYYLFLAESINSGQLPLWWHYTNLGYPFIEILQGSVFYIINYIFIPFFKYDPILAYNLNLIFHIILLEFAIFFYSNFLFENKKISFLIAILGSFSGAFISYIDYKSFNNSFPWIIVSFFNLHLGIFKVLHQKKFYIKNFFFYGFCFSLIILIGHPNIIVYTLLYSFIYILSTLLLRKEYFIKIFIIWIFSILITFPIWIILFNIFNEYVPFTARNAFKESIYNVGSYSIEMLITYYFPFIYSNFYVNSFQVEGVVKFEVIRFISVLAIPSFAYFLYNFIKINKNKIDNYNFNTKFLFILTIGLLSFILSFGKYTIFHYLAYFFPFYSSIKISLRNLIFFDFSLLFCIGFFIKDFFINSVNQNQLKEKLILFFKLFVSSFFMILIILFIFLFFNNFISYFYKIFDISILNCIFFIFILFYFIVFYFYTNFYKYKNIFIFFICLFFFIEGILYFYNLDYFSLDRSYDFMKSKYDILLSKKTINNKDNVFILYFYKLKEPTIIYFTNLSSILSNIRDMNYYDPMSRFDKNYILNNLYFFYDFYQLWNIITLNFPLSIYGIKYIPYVYNLKDIASMNFDKKNLDVINSIYNISYQDYKKKIKNIILFDSLKKNNLKNNYFTFVYKEITNDNKVLLKDNKPVLLGILFDKENKIYGPINIILRIKKNNLKINPVLKYLEFLKDEDSDIHFGYVDSSKIINYIDKIPSSVIPDDKFIEYIIPFYLSNNILYDKNKKYIIFFLETKGNLEYIIDKVEIYLYPAYLSPTFKIDNKYYNTYPILSDNYIKINDKKIIVSSLLYNVNSNEFINFVDQVDISTDIFDFKKKLFTLEFDIEKKAFLDQLFLKELNKYSHIKNLKYKNNYSIINEKNIKDIKFTSAKILEYNIFEKYNEISFKVESRGDSFAVINHLYYKYWKAYIDNIEVPVLKTNGIVMGIVVPEGLHKVVLKYSPWYANFFFVPFVATIFYLIILIAIFIKKEL